MNPIFFYIIASIWTLSGILFLIYAVIIIRRINAVKYWPSAPGESLSSEITSESDKYGDYYLVKIQYKYWAEGAEHISDHTSRRFKTKEEAQAMVNRYPPEASVVAYYNPKKPQDAVVEPSRSKRLFYALLFGGCGELVTGIVFLVIGPW